MSKKLARGPESYLNELLVLEMAPTLLSSKGFESTRVFRSGGMKFVQTQGPNGENFVFWLKQGWATTTAFSAIQFGMFQNEKSPTLLPDSKFVDYVANRSNGAKQRGATHILMIHMVERRIQNYVVLKIEDVPLAYAAQIAGWPNRARNTKTPTLYFEDTRSSPDAECVDAVTRFEVSLESVLGVSDDQVTDTAGSGSKKITAEVERRLQQAKFRVLVGDRCGWKCVVSGFEVKEVLDAAHLPGRDWRNHNCASDGIMIRSDLHRLLDLGLAEISRGLFVLSKKLREGQYSDFHERPISCSINEVSP